LEASHAGLEANFITGLFQNDLLTLELVVGMVELRYLSDNPESLSIQLLLQVGIKHFIELNVVTDSRKGENIAKSGAVIFNTLFRLILESLELFVKNLVGFWLQLDQKSEETDEVEETTDSQ
jgi:hypothetical protein